MLRNVLNKMIEDKQKSQIKKNIVLNSWCDEVSESVFTLDLAKYLDAEKGCIQLTAEELTAILKQYTRTLPTDIRTTVTGAQLVDSFINYMRVEQLDVQRRAGQGEYWITIR
jgi:hypothetical protein